MKCHYIYYRYELMISIKKILFVDDDVDDQLLFAEALKELIPVVTYDIANNGVEAFVYLESAATSDLPSLIFMDLNMPLMNGLQFLEKFQRDERLKHIPLIVFTTSNSPIDLEVTKRLGARLYITKPSDFITFKSRIKEATTIDFSNERFPVPFCFGGWISD